MSKHEEIACFDTKATDFPLPLTYILQNCNISNHFEFRISQAQNIARISHEKKLHERGNETVAI